jgi:hypothetical protein
MVTLTKHLMIFVGIFYAFVLSQKKLQVVQDLEGFAVKKANPLFQD